MRIVCMSDTHGMHRQVDVPDGDVLVHAGDITAHGSQAEVGEFIRWLGEQPHKHKVFIPGNHDRSLETRRRQACLSDVPEGVHYLCDSAIELDRVKFYGSPWTPKFFNWAFMLDRHDMDLVWQHVPEDTDVLVTHGPPYGHGDLAPRGRHAGCVELLWLLSGVADPPALHVFGHIHEGYGVTKSDAIPETTFVNAAICTGDYRPTNKPIVVDL